LLKEKGNTVYIDINWLEHTGHRATM